MTKTLVGSQPQLKQPPKQVNILQKQKGGAYLGAGEEADATRDGIDLTKQRVPLMRVALLHDLARVAGQLRLVRRLFDHVETSGRVCLFNNGQVELVGFRERE